VFAFLLGFLEAVISFFFGFFFVTMLVAAQDSVFSLLLSLFFKCLTVAICSAFTLA